MRLHIISALAFLALVVNVSTASSDSKTNISNDEVIQPFSSLRWDDGIFEVATKLNKLSGLKRLEWEGDELSVRKSVLNVTKTEELAILASELYESPGAEFIDCDGKTVASPNPDWNNTFVKGEEIELAGIPFKLSVRFRIEPGFAVANPNKTISFKTKKGVAKLPAVLIGVEFSSKSPAITEKLDDLIASVRAKYPTGKIIEQTNGSVRSGAFTSTDKLGHEFQVEYAAGDAGGEVTIAYSSTKPNWDELYRKHLAVLEEKKNKGNKDLKSEL